jgi:hypothetical protein
MPLAILCLLQITQAIASKFLLLSHHLLTLLRRMTFDSPSSLETTPLTFASVCALYPNMQTKHIGGGHIAYAHPCDDDGHLLITDICGRNLPHAEATEVLVARYARNNDPIGPEVTLSTSKLKEWIDATLDGARSPRSVADYFSKLLGASIEDDTLCTLSIHSGCGRDCVAAIDAGARLIAHIRMAKGTKRGTPELEDVIGIVRTITHTYRRG